MTDTDHRHDSLRDEWLARRQAALKKRTAARLSAAEAAFRAYTAHLAAHIPAARTPAEAAHQPTEGLPATAG